MQHHILINICAIFGIATAIIMICKFLKIRYIIGYLITRVLLIPNTSNYFNDMEEVDVYAETKVKDLYKSVLKFPTVIVGEDFLKNQSISELNRFLEKHKITEGL